MRSKPTWPIDLIQFTVEIQAFQKTAVNQNLRSILVVSSGERARHIIRTSQTKAKTIAFLAVFFGIPIKVVPKLWCQDVLAVHFLIKQITKARSLLGYQFADIA
ncbi:hypothetical protein D3C80_1410470 [compost metagenome]